MSAARRKATPRAATQRALAGKPVVLAFGGDVHFEGTIEHELARRRPRSHPDRTGTPQADIAVVNLETAVTNSGAPTAKAFVFRAPPKAFAALRGAGVDVASMANNHGLDYGHAGLRDSLAAAKQYRFPSSASAGTTRRRTVLTAAP